MRIKSKIKDIMMHTWFGVHFIEPVYRLWRYFWQYRPWVDDKTRVKQIFKKKLGYSLDLDNPTTFNEKINWLKINDRTDLHVICSDKIRMREYVKNKIGSDYVVPLFFTTDNPDDIRIENLPDEPVVVKSNHDSGTVYFIKNKYRYDLKRIRNNISFKLKKNHYWYAREWNYNKIKRRIIVEKMLTEKDNMDIIDYKIYCMNGIPKIILVDIDYFGDRRRNVYDTEWNLLDIKFNYKNHEFFEKPGNLYDLLKVASILSKPFIFVRVDLYSVNGDIFVGEMTFFPDAGVIKFNPKYYDKKFGSYLRIKYEK